MTPDEIAEGRRLLERKQAFIEGRDLDEVGDEDYAAKVAAKLAAWTAWINNNAVALLEAAEAVEKVRALCDEVATAPVIRFLTFSEVAALLPQRDGIVTKETLDKQANDVV